MDSILRDLDRERAKMQRDVDSLNRHYEKLAEYVRQHVRQSVIEWANLVLDHPRTTLLIVETTPVVDAQKYPLYDRDEHEPIRFTFYHLASEYLWDYLICPTYSKQVKGDEYHGLSLTDLQDKPTIVQCWPEIADHLDGRYLIIFGADYARNALQSVQQTTMLDNAYCLHNKSKEFYREFYELSLNKILTYQGIDKKREQLTDSRERILVLFQVLRNLAAGMPTQTPEQETLNNLDDLDGHPF